jgi:hypothetical protein
MHGRRVFCIAAVVWFAALMVSARPAEASCTIDDQGPCNRYWHTEMVLLGEVTDKVLLAKELGGDSFRLRVAVLEGFRGVGAAERFVTIHAREGECGVTTHVGERIFIYADREKDGAFWVSMYSGPLESSDEDLAYARMASTNAASALVYGEVRHRQDPVRDASSFTSLAGVTVRVRGKDFDATTTTDAEGEYSIRLPGAGRYEVDVIAPGGMAPRERTPTRFELANNQECFHAGFQLLTNGRIRGVVLDEQTGRPVPNLVLGVSFDVQQAKTDASGGFDLGPLSQGTYRLKAATGGGATFLPGTVTVSSGQATAVEPLVVRFSRPLTSVTFDLTDLSADGWIEILSLSIAMEIGKQKEVTIALEQGVSLDLHWSTATERKTATLKVDKATSRVKLSQLKWQPEP